MAAGTLAEVLANTHSLTAKYLTGELTIPVPKQRVRPSADRGWLEIVGARENNLKNLNARIPLGTLTCVTGVSGSGKSSLVDDTLRRALFRKFFGSKDRPGAHRALKGFENLDKVIVIDQTPIGRTPRSNPATYTGMFNAIRDLFTRPPHPRLRRRPLQFQCQRRPLREVRRRRPDQNRDALFTAGLCHVRGLQWTTL